MSSLPCRSDNVQQVALENPKRKPSSVRVSVAGASSELQATLRLLRRLADLKLTYPDQPFEAFINSYGYSLLGQDRVGDAITVFRFNTEAYPESWNVYDSLGEAYMENGDKELAIEFYRKSVELNPDNTGGTSILRQLER